jgi:hypothetical protein
MIVIEARGGVPADLYDEITRLQSALDALRHIADGSVPTERELGGSPLVDPWALAMRPAPCLVGGLHGHPNLSGPSVCTSELLVLAPDLGWARTRSRFYRLGRPAGMDHAS